MKTKITLKELEMWAKVYPNMTVAEFIKIFYFQLEEIGRHTVQRMLYLY